MATGFGKTCTNRGAIIRSLEKSYLVDSAYLHMIREAWDNDYGRRVFKEFPEAELMNRRKYEYAGPECNNSVMWNANNTNQEAARNIRHEAMITSGYWRLHVTNDRRGSNSRYFQEWDFTISVWAGERYVFHPQQAQKNIIKQHGQNAFERWRGAVIADLESFGDVIKAYNPPVSVFSVTCCPSSERVCKGLGIPVRNGFAFLTHRKGEICQHKAGLFKPADR